MEKELIRFNLFGRFTLEYNNQEIDLTDALGKKLVNLLETMVFNAGQELSSEYFYENFLEDADDPRSLLKYSIFRLRKGLKEISGLEDLELIRTFDDGYGLSDQYDYEVDVTRFSQLYLQIKNKTELETADYSIAKELVELYKGRLYSNTRSPIPVTISSERYSSEFANTVVLMSKYLLKTNRLEDMMLLNYDAIRIEPFYEGLHYYYMKGLVEVRDYHRALQYYDEVNERFYNELGTGLSPLFKNLYQMIQTEDEEARKEIGTVVKEMNENVTEKGGFFVTYELFKNMYELQIKNAKRSGKNYYLLMISVQGNISLKERVTVSNRVKEIITESIRQGDVFARVNKNQFVILLECREIDNVYLVASRITSRFHKKYHQKNYRLNYSVEIASENSPLNS